MVVFFFVFLRFTVAVQIVELEKEQFLENFNCLCAAVIVQLFANFFLPSQVKMSLNIPLLQVLADLRPQPFRTLLQLLRDEAPIHLD